MIVPRIPAKMFAALFIALVSAGGCSSKQNAAAGKPIVWLSRDLSVEEATIDVGYRDGKLAPGGWLEPVVQIAKDGEPVAEAMVFCRLVSPDGQATLGDESATVFETATRGKLGLYGQGKLTLPDDADSVAIRVRIILPSLEQEWTKDVALPMANSARPRDAGK